MVELISSERLISEISAEPFFKDNPHLVDKPAIYRWVKIALGTFGRNILVKKQQIVHISNYKGETPKGLKQLSVAIKLDVDQVDVYTENRSVQQSSFMWKERIERWGLEDKVNFGCQESCEPLCEKTITENFYLNAETPCQIKYKNPIYLKLGDSLMDDSCESKSVNRYNFDPRFQINIKEENIYTNFRNGVVYLQYYAVPSDEKGIPLIPDTDSHSMQEYIEYVIKRKLLERAMWSKDAVNLQNIFQFTVGKEKELLSSALKDSSPINMQTIWEAIEYKRKEAIKFKINLK